MQSLSNQPSADFNFQMSKLIVEELRGVESIDALRPEWQPLFNASDASPFLSWEWIAAWQKWISDNRTPYILCARDGRKLVGLLPLGMEAIRVMGFPLKARKLTLLGDGIGGADYLDLLVLPEYAEEAASVIFDHLTQCVQFDVLMLNDMAADSSSLPLLTQRLRSGFRYRLTPRFVCPQIELGGSWTAILKLSRRGNNFKRRLRQLRERDGFEHRVITRPEDSEAAFERFLSLHNAVWNDRGGSDVTGHKLLLSFHRDVVEQLATAGLLRFDELWVEGACRASIYGLDDGRRHYLYNSGYDPAWSKSSPGLVLLGLSIENAANRGIERYDFLRGSEIYKFDWATTTRETVTLLITRRNLSAMFFNGREQARLATRSLAKALLPKQLAVLMRRWRRYRKFEQKHNVENNKSLVDYRGDDPPTDRG